ncbi:ComF family protein [Terrirubrum flagellatum]|uniref:ComF family protein n=1 Tax=Terrirubrum flagellatum TaxID=2895980 RepID=UPI003CC81D8C
MDATPDEHCEAPLASRALAAARSFARRGGSAFADLLWPPVCAHCRAATSIPDGLCARCWSRLALIERPYCERLGTPFALDIGGKLLSPEAIANPPVFDRARAVARYDDIARSLTHRQKYGDQLHLAVTMGTMMAAAGRELLAEADAILPIPLHRFRLWTRRYNQAALLARMVAKSSGKSLLLDALIRVRRTRPQVGLTRAERAANLAGAFKVPADRRPAVEGRRLLLIDDVLTTGATVSAAARALRRAGAAGVDVLTFARVTVDA